MTHLNRLLWLAALLPLAAVAGQANSMPVPGSVSEVAQAYYRDFRPRPRNKLDYQNERVMRNVRKTLNKMFLANAQKISTDYELEAVDAKGARAFWVRTPATRRNDKVFIYLHGGGYILGSAEANLGVPLRVTSTSGVPVLSVDYRLAPEHPFPAGLNDALAAYQWLLDQGYKNTDIGVFGDSAGGGLTLALALAARDGGMPVPGALAVLSPGVDLTNSGDTYATLNDFDPILQNDSDERAKLYAGEHGVSHPLVSPVFADYAGISPLLIQVGTREILLSDSVRLARKARADGVDVTLDVWDGMWHVWQDHPNMPEAEQASLEIGQFLLSHLNR